MKRLTELWAALMRWLHGDTIEATPEQLAKLGELSGPDQSTEDWE